MSVFDLPRLHFAGTATTSLPTGPRSGWLDQATNQAITAAGPFPVHLPPEEYHARLDAGAPRFDADGSPCTDGPFNVVRGWNLGGSGHFGIDARITGGETADGPVDDDLVVGRYVDMWGHYNPYLATTFNKARIFDVDPASPWSTTVMVGHFCFGRGERSHEVGYLVSGSVEGTHPARWQDFAHVGEPGTHPFDRHTRTSFVHQFAVRADDGLDWMADSEHSPLVNRLRATIDDGRAAGLVVQFRISAMALPTVPDRPNQWRLVGTIAPWQADELVTHPAGRVLVPVGGYSPLRTMSVAVTADQAVFNMVNAVPATRRCADGSPEPGSWADAGDLELRTQTGDRLVARVPAHAYRADGGVRTGGLITVAREASSGPVGDEALCLLATSTRGVREMVLRERETVIASDDASLFVEQRGEDDADGAVEVRFRSFVRGRPAAVSVVHVQQFGNPGSRPLDPVASALDARCAAVELVAVSASGAAPPQGSSCLGRTDEAGHGSILVRGLRAGSTRLLLTADEHDLPCDPDEPGSAWRALDGEGAHGFWAHAGSITVRVLPDHRHLDDLATDDVDAAVVYREVFTPYELLYTFMKNNVFSLAHDFRVETHPRLLWNMCDPRNKDKTYYMPPSRDLSDPQARVLLKFLRARRAQSTPPERVPADRGRDHGLDTRDELIAALRQAATIELAVMMQYLYAVYSLPTRGAAQHWVDRGEWTPDQIRRICGDGGETLDDGVRGRLLSVAREEMIHFLVINNILMAIGEPFLIPDVDFGDLGASLAVPFDFALEPFGLGSLQRFIAIEQPDGSVDDVRRGDLGGIDLRGSDQRYGSLSELYGAVRDGLQRVPDLFMVRRGRGGGEHHLFMRESVNAVHPDYQLQVDDLPSALFAIDFVTEQGEGHVLTDVPTSEDSHHETFLRMSRELMADHLAATAHGRTTWSPAYPVLRNPTVRASRAGSRELVTAPEAREVAVLFNRAHFMMCQLMVHHFTRGPETSLRRSDLMNAALEVMTGMMRPLGELLVTLPSGRPGRTAGPTFELESRPQPDARPEIVLRTLSLRFAHLAEACRKCELVPASVGGTASYLAGYFGGSA